MPNLSVLVVDPSDPRRAELVELLTHPDVRVVDVRDEGAARIALMLDQPALCFVHDEAASPGLVELLARGATVVLTGERFTGEEGRAAGKAEVAGKGAHAFLALPPDHRQVRRGAERVLGVSYDWSDTFDDDSGEISASAAASMVSKASVAAEEERAKAAADAAASAALAATAAAAVAATAAKRAEDARAARAVSVRAEDERAARAVAVRAEDERAARAAAARAEEERAARMAAARAALAEEEAIRVAVAAAVAEVELQPGSGWPDTAPDTTPGMELEVLEQTPAGGTKVPRGAPAGTPATGIVLGRTPLVKAAGAAAAAAGPAAAAAGPAVAAGTAPAAAAAATAFNSSVDALNRTHETLEWANYYDVLAVERTSSAAGIKRAFLARAVWWHPDGFAAHDDPTLRERAYEVYKRMSEAYRVLGDPAQRLEYDRMLHRGQLRYLPETRGGGPRPEDSVATEARRFYLAGIKALASGDRLAAKNNLRLALGIDPGNSVILARLRETQEATEAAERAAKSRGGSGGEGSGPSGGEGGEEA